MSRTAIQRFLHQYEWLHITVGVIGNATFFIGSIFFLPVYSNWMTVGVWLFITGSFLMLLGALAGGLKRHWEHTYGLPEGLGASQGGSGTGDEHG